MVYHQNALKSGQMHVSIPALGMGTRYQLLGGENLALITQTYMNRLKLAVSNCSPDFTVRFAIASFGSHSLVDI